MDWPRRLFVVVLPLFFAANSAGGQDPKALALVQLAVKTELAADQNDHSQWLYYEVDRKPKDSVTQWVAETAKGNLHAVLAENGYPVSSADRRKKMDSFIHDAGQQAEQRKSGHHDDDEATQMLKLLPTAFVWTTTGSQGGSSLLHFKPDPRFHPPTRESRVFAAMEGDMKVDDAGHRIVSLKGRLIRDVKFGGGLLGRLNAGGSFDVERREIGKNIWQITETHVHIDGRALLFKSISEQEDDEKSKFEPLPPEVSLEQAEARLLRVGE
jgi:hypothetical protein